MPDLRQALKDFVATSNSGKYSDEKTLLSKFPELQGYDINILRDFVATSNSGKYATEDEVFSKFPEFELKKKEQAFGPLPAENVPSFMESPSELGQSELPEPTKPDTSKIKQEPTETLAVGPMGITGLQRTKDYVPAEDQGKQGDVLNLVSSLDKGFYKNLIGSPVKGLGSALEGATGKGFVSDALIKFGDYFNKTIDELTPQDEEFKNSLTDQFGQAFGQVASLIVTQGAAGLASKAPTAVQAAKTALSAQAIPEAAGAVGALKTLGTELISPTAVSAGLSMGQGEFDRAKEAGATDEQAFEAFYKNAAVGSILEKIPVMQFLKRFEKASAGGISNYIKTKGVAGITGGLEEMTTEVLQGIYSNLSAQDIYNANQNMFEGLAEAGGVGFGVGFLLNAMGANVKILRSQGKDDEANIIEQQIAQFESQAQKGGPSSYSVNGITIQPIIAEGVIQQEPRDIVSGMIDNMTATDLSKMNIDITNDPELNIKLQDKIVTSSIKEQVRESNPNLNEEQLDEITNLEKELRKFEGNTTQSGKDKAASIRSQIKTIQDAVQEQTAGELPIQPRAGVSEALAEGESQAEPQVPAEEGVQAEVVQEEVVPNRIESENILLEREETPRDKDGHYRFAIKNSETNEDLGSFSFNYREDLGGYQVENAKVSQAGTGAGTNTYRILINNLDKPLISDSARSRSADAVWSNLEREGLAKFNEQENKYFSIKQQPTVSSKTQEEVTIGEYNPTEEVKDKDMSVLNEVLSKKKVQPEAEPDVTDFGDTVVFEYYDSSVEGDFVTRLTFKKNKNGEIVGRGVKVEKGVNRIKETKLFKDFVNTQTQAAQEVAPVVEEVAPVVEQYTPITPNQITNEKFTRDNSIDYEEGERETDSGRTVTYLASITVEAQDDNGDVVGSLTKITDEDGGVSWNAADIDGNELSFDNFDSKDEAKQALVDKVNKERKKEFDKEAKKKAKAAEKAAAKKPKPATPPTAQVIPEEGPTAEDLSSIEAMLDLDIEDEDNMLSILNALDKVDNAISKRLRGSANEALLAIPLSTIQVVVKALKTLVKGGMLLRDAIKKVAADNNLSQDTIKDILNIAPIQDGFNALMDKVGAMIQRQTSRGTEEKRMVSNIDTLVRNSDVYQNANDAQKKILEREARTQAGVRERRAPSIGRVLGVLKDITNVSREDKLKIISEIRQLSKDAAKDLAKEIKELATQGKITVNQAANIVSRFGKVNMLSEISVSKFVDYMTKVFNDAEYASKLGTAKSLKKDIKKLSKIKDKNANLKDLGQKFSEIDPLMVENIDSYNEMASKIKEAIKGSTIRGQKVSLADMVNIDDASEYINKTLDAQDKMMREEKAAEIQSLMGIDVSEFSYDDMMMLLESKEPITKYNEGIIRSTINKAFNVFSSLINETINTGKDPFTGEDVEFTKSQKDVVKRFMDMDLSLLKPKEALQAVDALSNFLQNKSTAKMETVVSEYDGIKNAKELSDKGVKAYPLKKYFSKWLGGFLGEQVTNLNVLFERMFKGFNIGGKVMDKMGFTKLINKKSFGQTQSNNIVQKYVNQFYKKTANGEAFNSEYNNTERGLAAFVTRSVVGTEQQMADEFDRRKGLVQESIQVLSEGNDKEQAKAELYQKAYDKIVTDSDNIKDVLGKVDKTNSEAIEFWKNEWSEKYEQLSDVSLNVYNKVLGKDLNYTPDRFAKLSSDTGVVELDNEDSAFHTNNGTIYQRETGVLMTATRPDSLPKDSKSGDANRYIDLSFDSANANSMYDALIDINTAAPIRQIQSFLNSSYFKKIVPNADDAKILKDRISLYVGNIRNKNPYSNDELSKAVKGLNKIAAIGVGQALGGITQPIKQVIPVAMNTIINAGGLDVASFFNEDKMKFLMDSGYAIANRGVESQAQIESINRLIEEAAKSKGQKALNLIEQANKKWIDIFLVKPDVFIAKVSWMTYYEQSLKKQGIETKNIDYSKQELNEDAANYAQRMVDRQQNVSDSDLAGKLFSNKESSNQLLVKTLMPFASFRMNQSARVGADLATLTNSTSTAEDKKIAAKSLAGFGVEMITFRLVSIATSILLGTLAKKIMGREEDDEEKKKRIDNIIKGAKTGTFTDIFSPLPIADKLVQKLGSPLLNKVEEMTGMPVSIFEPKNEEFLKSAGLFGIAADRAGQLWELNNLAITGTYTDDFGKEKTISQDNMDALKMLIAPAIMTNIGLAPSEVNTVIRYAIKDAKKKPSKTAEEAADSIDRAEDKAESKEQKAEALEKIKSRTSNPKLIEAIDEKIDELEASAEEKKVIKQQNKEEKQLKEELLTDPVTGREYDNESKLKRYNKSLWNKNFGPRSEWFKEHKYENEAESLMNKEIRKIEDKEYGYSAPVKKRKNSDGSTKRTYGRKN